MRRQLRQLWRSMTIKEKIQVFTGAVFVTCLLSIIFNIWVVKFSLVDFNYILEQNSKCVNLVQALEVEKSYFQDYVQRQEITDEVWEEAIAKTKQAVAELPFVYGEIGDFRYAQTWSIHNSYEVYVAKRDAFLASGKQNPNYINDLYTLYDMQDYMIIYAKNLMADTMEVSSEKYQEKIPSLLSMPWLVVVLGCVLISVILNIATMLNKSIIVPVMKLVKASKQIADNDFYVEDVEVENKDELGELVHAFNKMKFATGEYISALEEKRKTLDLLHAEELEKLEIEGQLESIQFDLLKSQVNPHFLFNTLNVIRGMANLEDAPTTEKMIKALSSLFRYNLKTDDMVVPLFRELKVVEDYMYLQQMRFGERISYDLVCKVDAERIQVPAFTFQPLVENAIIHGLSPKEEGGKVRVRILMQGDKLNIYIGDTGIGMTEKELLELKEKLQQNQSQGTSHRGIGLGNIYNRVNAMYEDGYVDIYSKLKVGTVIKVVIPQDNEERYVSSNSSRR